MFFVTGISSGSPYTVPPDEAYIIFLSGKSLIISMVLIKPSILSSSTKLIFDELLTLELEAKYIIISDLSTKSLNKLASC